VTYSPLDLANVSCNYDVLLRDGTHVEFKATAFMIWCGLRQFLEIYHPSWVLCKYDITLLCESGVTYHTSEDAKNGKPEATM